MTALNLIKAPSAGLATSRRLSGSARMPQEALQAGATQLRNPSSVTGLGRSGRFRTPAHPVLQQSRRQSCSSRTRANAGGDAPGETAAVAVPRGPEETAQQALAACLRAFKDGVLRQRVELLLPLIGATDLDDWPGGVQQQFKAVLPMVETILKGLKQEEGLQGPLQSTILDQGDAVGQWKGDKLASVVFPTGQTLKNVKELAKDSSRLVIMVNPQWQAGQVISDFGIGPWRKANEDFVAEFDEVYHLSQTRISGDECRILRSYPGKWQVHAVDAASRTFPLVAIEDTKPDYARLAEILKSIPGSNASKSWDERLRSEIQFNTDSLKPPQ